MAAVTKREILALRGEIVRLARAHGAADIQLFGSVARDEADETSDIDFLVTPAPETPPFFPGGMIAALEDLLDCNVQITLSSPQMSVRLRRAIERDRVAL
ncbi:MAG: nucleotidyltransferase family protein [Thermomicrobiales bacterium]